MRRRRCLREDEHEALADAGDVFARAIAKAAADALRRFPESVRHLVLMHLQDCTSLHSPYTAGHIRAFLAMPPNPETAKAENGHGVKDEDGGTDR